jgi:serine/threonine-protein kinase
MAIVEGRELGGCRLLRKIGAGGMGDVYLAEQLRVGNRLVAVKIVNPDDHTFDREVAEDLKRRFEREAALLGQLPHPNILPVYDSGVQDGLLYLVMEYVPDGSLADAIRGTASHPLKLPAALPFTLEVISQLGAALQSVHDHGVVHRDVKPGNVLVRVGADGQWKVLLADFGVARNLDTASQRTQVTGTFPSWRPNSSAARSRPPATSTPLACSPSCCSPAVPLSTATSPS